ncbi:anoctamin-5-like isoform X4 [Oratosquilla oratoria]|uniref:anoctamin-5-like isoform X4 n=1 Tax=Oratosquilla oratoria TaxID=337810 RepID=UPI003F75DE08
MFGIEEFLSALLPPINPPRRSPKYISNKVVMSTSGGDSEYSTPLQSHRTSRHLASPTSYTSVYYSATDLYEPEMEKELMADHQDINMEEVNGDPPAKQEGEVLKPELYFKDEVRSIDFVLVSRIDPENEHAAMHEDRRKVFEENLEKEGLSLEIDFVQDVPLRFVKIHAPFEVCTRYAEILKLRMPMKERLGEFPVHLQFQLFPGLPVLEFATPSVLLDMTDWLSSIFDFVRTDNDVFPPKNRHFTAVYSRDREYLFDVTDQFFIQSIRARIVDFIIRRKKFIDECEGDEYAFGIERLRNDGTYDACYPIHDGDIREEGSERCLLYRHWASLINFYKYQPLDYIKEYYGVKIGLYFAWLGYYTYMLIPASIVGFLCFIYAVSSIHYHEPSNDICDKRLNITMCPLCDHFCSYWKLEETCFHAKFTYLVDNPATVFFAVFMSFWAALFLEMWKRYSAEITHRWDLTGFDIQEEHPRPQYLARLAHIKKKTVNIVTKTIEPKPPFWRMRFPGVVISMSSVLLLVTMALTAVVGVIIYRMSALAALNFHREKGETIITSHAMIFTSATAALINLCCIMVFNQIYARVAEKLTELELQRTQTEFDDSLTLKIYLLQFINYYASIIYIAFFKGKMVGYPGNYNRVFGSRQEECSPGGCLLELSVQLAIIMVGKQAMNTCMEMVIPQLWKWYNMLTVPEQQREVHRKWPRWAKDFRLVDFDPRGLFPEYLEMECAACHHPLIPIGVTPSLLNNVLQYGFVTIFVASFPLAPLFAFVNNVFEMRLDARKLLTHFRRPVSQRVKDIGIWFKILDSIGKLAVITNAFIIAFTSNFIPELVYRHVVSHDKSLGGFLNHSLSVFDVKDYKDFDNTTDFCRYPDYRNPPSTPREYDYAPIFWHILAARLAFVVVFENIVCLIIMFIKWMIPDMPFRLQEQIRREAYLTNELIVEQELCRARGDLLSVDATHSPRSMLRRQCSEPARRGNNAPQDVRFRLGSSTENSSAGVDFV